MPEYIIERDITGAGHLSLTEQQGIAQKSCYILRDMRPGIQRLESYVRADKVHYIDIAGSNKGDPLSRRTRRLFCESHRRIQIHQRPDYGLLKSSHNNT
jgi:hypothetical protein